MIALEEEFSDLLRHVESLLASHRGRRITVYIEPELADAAIDLVESGRFESRSAVLDTSLRRQLLHELQSAPTYGFFLSELDGLSNLLGQRIPKPNNLARVSQPTKRRPNENERGRKVRVSSRTNEGIHLLAQMVIDDPDTQHSNISQFVEAGLHRILN